MRSGRRSLCATRRLAMLWPSSRIIVCAVTVPFVTQVNIFGTVIPYTSDEHADAACKNPHLKLVFRLIECFILDEGIIL